MKCRIPNGKSWMLWGGIASAGICKLPDCRLWETLGSSLIPVIFSLFQHIVLISFDSLVVCCSSVFQSVPEEPGQKVKCFDTLIFYFRTIQYLILKCFHQFNFKLLNLPLIKNRRYEEYLRLIDRKHQVAREN